MSSTHSPLNLDANESVEPLSSVVTSSRPDDDEWDSFAKELEAIPDVVVTPTQSGRKWPQWILDRRAREALKQAHHAPVDAAPFSKEWNQRAEDRMRERDLVLDDIARKERQRSAPISVETEALLAELDTVFFVRPHASQEAVLGENKSAGFADVGSDYERDRCQATKLHEGGTAVPESPPLSLHDDLDEAVEALEHSWRSTATSATPISPETDASNAVTSNDDGDSIGCSSAPAIAPAFIPEHLMHRTWPAFQAHKRLQKAKLLVRKLSKNVIGLSWQDGSGGALEKKFPFLHKNPALSSAEKGCKAFREEWELSHQVHPDREILASPPTKPTMPAWNKLPTVEKRSPSLNEVIAGARFTSIAFRGQVIPQDWAHTVPGSDVMCIAIDLHGEAAARFLAGEYGDVGKSLTRRLLRRLDHRGVTGDVTAGAIWTKPSSSSCPVRVFMMFQQDNSGSAEDVELNDRARRFLTNLRRHGVPVTPGDTPLKVKAGDLATYLGLTEDEITDRGWCGRLYDGGVREIEEYSPEEGFASPEVLATRRKHSFRKWIRFTSKHGLPAWISPEFMELLEDYFFFSAEHVRARDRLRAAKEKSKHAPRGFTKSDRLALERLEQMELSPGDICIFRCSPAQFAAIAIREGVVLGEYFDSAHKAGRAKDLYETIRRDWLPTP